MSGLEKGAELTEVQLKAATTVNTGYGNVEWYVCHTSLDELTTIFDNNYDGNTPQKVYSQNSVTFNAVNGQWFGFAFFPSFTYNGTGNLIFELRYSSNGSSINAQGASKPKRVIEAENASGTTGSYGPFNWMPGLRIYYEGTSINTVNQTDEQSSLFSVTKNTGNIFLINYLLTEPAETRIMLYDISGRLVKTLETEKQDAGNYSLNICTTPITSGIYFIKFDAGEYMQNAKLILSR